MSRKQAITDERVVRFFNKVGKAAKLSLDYSFLSSEQEYVGIFYDENVISKIDLDGYDVDIPTNGVCFLLLKKDEIRKENVKEIARLLAESYLNQKDVEQNVESDN